MFPGIRGNALHGDYSPGQLRSTKSYIFKTEDVLGEGATSHVFLGRNKKSGEKVAVKVFNNASYERPNAVQEREFSVLLKIKHENIVQLLAIENDQISRQRIILMELCDCSVLNMLDKPKYIYGFPEREFLDVLRDMTAGMKYLQENGIVHRDIKPGNIMRRLGPDRQSTYKLADFGAARELQNDEHFVSLYGTEEYLHPDMFERALLRKPLLKPFTTKVDLWSLGVTLYHIATGLLPFRPFGGRKNRTTMHKITTTKATGVISGVQRDSEHGPITWSTELPKHCRLSFGLKLLVTDMLAGLLECNTERMWSFETYFNTANSIVSMRTIDVLNIATSQLLKVYIDPKASYAEFQEHVAMQTNIPADQQTMIYDNQPFHPDASVTCSVYPDTSENYPVMMVPKCFDGTSSPVPPSAPSMPQVKPNYSLENDYPYARLCAAVVHFFQWTQEQLLTLNTTNDTVTKAISAIAKQHIMQLSLHQSEVTLHKESIEGILKCQEENLRTILSLLDAYLVVANGSRLDGELIRQELTDVQRDVKEMRDTHEKIVSRWRSAHDLLQQLQVQTSGSDRVGTWLKDSGCQPADTCRERLGVLLEDIEGIMSQFRKDRKLKQLPYNEEQIHKMDKVKLNEKSTQATSLLYDHCTTRWREGHSQLMNWFSEIAPMEKSIYNLDTQLTTLVYEYPKLLQEVRTRSSRWDARISEATARLSLLLKKPQSPKILLLNQSSVRAKDELDQSQTDDGRTPIKICYPPTMGQRFLTSTVSPTSTQQQSAASPGSPTSRQQSAMSQVSPGVSPIKGDQPISSAGSPCSPTSRDNENGMMIRVSKSFKREVEEYHNQAKVHSTHTREELERGQMLMKQMQDIPLGIPDQPDCSLPNHLDGPP